MAKYLGEHILKQEETEIFKDFSKADWARYFIEEWGLFDAPGNKEWLLDQTLRILYGTPVIIKLAIWDDGYSEYRVTTSKDVPEEYKRWRINAGEEYNEGRAP